MRAQHPNRLFSFEAHLVLLKLLTWLPTLGPVLWYLHSLCSFHTSLPGLSLHSGESQHSSSSLLPAGPVCSWSAIFSSTLWSNQSDNSASLKPLSLEQLSRLVTNWLSSVNGSPSPQHSCGCHWMKQPVNVFWTHLYWLHGCFASAQQSFALKACPECPVCNHSFF